MRRVILIWTPRSPAMYNQVISVGAVDSDGQKASFSNYGHMVDVAAPGVDILSTYPTALTDENYAPYAYMDGTSMACPHVSGAAAVLLSKYPSMTIEQLRATLRATAGDGNGTRSDDLGYGVVKIDRALNNTVNHYGNINSPEFFAGVNQGLIKINGSTTGANFKSYKLEYCRGLFPKGPWATIKESTSKVDSGELAEWDTSGLSLGTYTLRLSVEGNGSSYIHQIYHKIYLTTNNQSGWPRIIEFLPGYVYSDSYQTLSPLFADLEGDGSLECALMSSAGRVYAWDKDGSLKNGFPVEFRSSSSTSLNAADINNDGKLELIAGMQEDSYDRGEIYGFDYQGNLLSGWPPSGLPSERSLTRMTPAIGNLDGGSDLEVVTNINTGQNKFYGFKSNGTQVSGWPVNNASPDGEAPILANIDDDEELEAMALGSGELLLIDGNGSLIRSIALNASYIDTSESPALTVGDVDGDGKLEIVACVDTQASGKKYKFFVYELDGTLVSSWEITQPDNIIDEAYYFRNLALGDLNKDGKNEIIFATPYSEGTKETDILQNKIYAWDSQGNLFFGKTIDLGADEGAYSSAVLADLDGDAQPEIVIGTDSGKIHAYDKNGNVVSGFPIETGGWLRAPLAIADVDSDGKLEALAVSVDGVVNLVELPSSGPADRVEWPMFQHDNQHTGCYVVPDATIPKLKALEMQSGFEGQKITFQLQAEKGTPPYTYGMVSGTLPQGATLSSSGAFSWTPGYEQSQTEAYTIKAKVTDSKGNVSKEEPYTVRVFNSSLYGVVKDAATSIAIAGAQIDLVRKSDGVTVYTTNSDSQGKYLITQDINSGEYRMEISFSGYNDKTIEVSLTKGQTNEANVELTVYVANNAPVITYPQNNAVFKISEGESFSLTVSATDADADTLSYSSGSLPSGANFNTATHTFTWAPDYKQGKQSYNAVFYVTDGKISNPVSVTVTLDVANAAKAPEFSQGQDAKSTSEGQTFTYTLPEVSASYGDSLEYALSGSPDWLSLNNRQLTGTAAYDSQRSYEIQWKAKDTEGEATFTLALSVNNTAGAPVFSPGYDIETITEETESFDYTLPLVSESYGNNLTYRLEGEPEWLSFNENNRNLSGKAPYESERSYTIKWIASDTEGESAFTLTLNVSNKERPPEFKKSSDSLSVNEGEALEYSFPMVDRNYGTGLTYSLSDKPDWATIDTATGRLTVTEGNVPFDGSGGYPLHWIAQDSEGSATFILNLTIDNVNRAPVLEPIGNKEVSEGSSVSFTIHAADSDGDSLTYSAEGKLPDSASFNTAGAVFSWIPNYTQAGSYTLTFKVSDGNDSDSEEIAITVSNSPHAPEFSKPSDTQAITEDTENFEYSLPEVANNYGNDLRYTLENKPEWLDYNENSRKLSGKAPYDSKRSYEINWIARDSEGEAAFALTINVTDKKRPPEFSKKSDKIDANEGESIAYSLPKAESKITDEVIAYSVTEKPDFVTVDVSSAKATGEVSYDNGDNDYQLIWKATGEEGEDSFTLNISVKDMNRSPVIETISDYTINEGESLSFTVNTYDDDSEDTLVTTLKHVPDGASFVDLVFKWAPTYKQSGKYTLTLTSSDGKAKAEQDFTIEVLDAQGDDEESEDTSKDTDDSDNDDSNEDDSTQDSQDSGESEDSDTNTDSSANDISQETSDSSNDEESEVTISGGSTWVVVQEPKKTSTSDSEDNEDKKEGVSGDDKSLTQSVDAESEYQESGARRSEEEEERVAMRSEPQNDGYDESSVRDSDYEETSSASSEGSSVNFMAVHNNKGILKEIQVLNERADIVHSYKIKYGKRNSLIGLFRNDAAKAYVYIDTDGITVKKVKIKNTSEILDEDLKKEVDGIIAFMGFIKNN